jgi:hypothetical protein
VIFALACRNSSCTTFTSSPFAFSKVEKVRRKVCHPMCLVIPALSAAARMHRFRIASGLYGCFPFFLVLAKIQFRRAETTLRRTRRWSHVHGSRHLSDLYVTILRLFVNK